MIEAFRTLLNQYKRITIVAHKRPDGDTIGTALGIYTLLKNIGKQVEVCCIDEKLPKNLDFLPHFARIKRQIDFEDSLIIACDASEASLFGFDFNGRELINLDHHQFNEHFGSLNIVDTSCASTSQVAYKLLKDDFEMTKEVATCFYVALLTDTQAFMSLSVNQEVFALAAELLSYGVDVQEVTRNLYMRNSLSSLRFLSGALNTLSLHHEGEVASFVVSQKLFKESGSNTSELAGIVEYGINLATVKMAIILIEYDTWVKVALRSKKTNVAKLAEAFGGGGHHFAAGFKMEKMEIETVLKKILDETKKGEY